MGVPEVWIVDPQTRTLYVLNGTTTMEHREGVLRVSGMPAELDVHELFSVLKAS